MRLLEGKVCAITGGTTGIGRAIALEYLEQGAMVAVSYLAQAPSGSETSLSPHGDPSTDLSAMQAVVKSRGSTAEFIAIAGDVREPSAGTDFVSRIVEKWGRLDVFVSNAGVCRFENFLDVGQELLEGTFATNLAGAFWGVQAAARQMKQQFDADSASRCSIIAISSISALVGGARQTHYTPTKAGVLSLMQSCAAALGGYGIRCNALLPGTIRTQMNDTDLSDPGKRAYMENRTPLGRLGAPEDLAGPALFLACERLSGYVTGAQLLVDGGAFVNLQ